MTRLALWDPFRDIADFRYSIDRVFDRGFGRPFRLVNWDAVTELFPVDVYETDDEVTVKASLPGVQPDKVEISVTGNKLTIKGESSEESDETGSTYHRQELRRGAFYRALRLPSRVDADPAHATF
ncbi:MAG: Hsp20/alpha crystallin family protein, partial [Chloroflexi bacterium]|nr:Hsp20/alpha crystallin family protein [Chloroflexota bacterium]